MDVYEDLGVRPFINAADNYTRFGGSIMWPCAVEAMVEASRKFVNLYELQAKVGEAIAEITGNDAAYVSCGAAGGIALAVAACMAGTDPRKIEQLPDTRGHAERGHRAPLRPLLRRHRHPGTGSGGRGNGRRTGRHRRAAHRQYQRPHGRGPDPAFLGRHAPHRTDRGHSPRTRRTRPRGRGLRYSAKGQLSQVHQGAGGRRGHRQRRKGDSRSADHGAGPRPQVHHRRLQRPRQPQTGPSGAS